MKLLAITYRSNKPRQILILCLGTNGTKLIGIESTSINDTYKKLIRANSQLLDNLSLDKKIIWMKKYCPQVIQNCKTYMLDKCSIDAQYEI